MNQTSTNARIVIDGREFLPKPRRQAILATVRRVIASVAEASRRWVFVTFVQEEHMRALNQKWRGVAKSTDVLSLVAHEEHDGGHREAHVDTPLGDLLICVDVARRQADRLGHTLCEEIAVLTAHGMCHLLGMDHERGAREALLQLRHEQALLHAAGVDAALALINRNSDNSP
ncbi:MAG: rRNA maturation RNase YbeY [Myxococcota bacterium]